MKSVFKKGLVNVNIHANKANTEEPVEIEGDAAFTLSYFDLYGRAEPSRMMLAMSDIKYEDSRLNMTGVKESWPAIKPTMAGGMMPTIRFPDGRHFGESQAINRYVARITGFYPDDPILALKTDAVSEVINTTATKMSPNMNPTYKDNCDVVFDTIAPELVKFIEENLGDQDFMCGDKMTMADFVFVGEMYDIFFHMKEFDREGLTSMSEYGLDRWPKVLEANPKFDAYGQRCCAFVKEYMDKRAVCDY